MHSGNIMYADVIIDISHKDLDKTFEYRIPEELSLSVGDMVIIPFGKGDRTRTGYVVDIKETPVFDVDKIKCIVDRKEGGLPIESKLIKLAAWMHRNYGGTMIAAMKTVMPVKRIVTRKKPVKQISFAMTGQNSVDDLTEAQREILNEFRTDYDLGERKTYLLHGITGSGKTEVYIRLASHVVGLGRKVIILIPEIALTYQMVARFQNHFGDRVSVINSSLSEGEKFREFEKAKSGETDIIIGPRSALFTPYKDVGLIIIDEEHDLAYKSDNIPKYHARETAVERARLEGASVVLGSATPSMESYYRAEKGEYKLWELPERPNAAELPTVDIIDLREELRNGNKSIISGKLYEKMQDAFNHDEKVMLFLNKRGYNSFISCRSCGEAVKCPNCSVSLSYHRGNVMMCHYCGHREPAPKVCPKCGSPFIAGFGTGTEKLAQSVEKLFPGINVFRMDKDTTSRKGAHGSILEEFRKPGAGCLVGTQMIVKGHDFPDVTVVGVVLADMGLFNDDYSAPERTFDLLTQAAGRAGRADRKGSVVIQTYMPDNYAIQFAAEQDYKGFYEMEIAYRRALHFPPVYKLTGLLVSSKDEELLEGAAGTIAETLRGKLKSRGVAVIGPGVAKVSKLSNVYRRVIYIKSADDYDLSEIEIIVADVVQSVYNGKDVAFSLDRDPVNMM